MTLPIKVDGVPSEIRSEGSTAAFLRMVVSAPVGKGQLVSVNVVTVLGLAPIEQKTLWPLGLTLILASLVSGMVIRVGMLQSGVHRF